MTGIWELRSKLITLYQKIDIFLKPFLKFVLCFAAFYRLTALFGFDRRFTGIHYVIIASLIGAMLPMIANYALAVLYIAMQLSTASVIMSFTTLMIAVVMYCFFIRLVPNYSAVILAMPVLIWLKFPYVLPIGLGLFGSAASIIPVCIGIFTYYFLQGLNVHMVTFEQLKSSEDSFKLYIEVMKDIMSNKSMIAMLVAFSLVIGAMCLIRFIRMDYSFEIAITAGTSVSMLIYIIMMLRSDLDVGLFAVIAGSLISGLLVFLAHLLFRPLQYAGTENVQFEDDDYYYYVRAVPKIKTIQAAVSEKQVITLGRNHSEEAGESPDDEEEKVKE